MLMERLTLSAALRDGRLEDFIVQAEEGGIGLADQEDFDRIVERITAPPPSGQTSRSRGSGGSRGK